MWGGKRVSEREKAPMMGNNGWVREKKHTCDEHVRRAKPPMVLVEEVAQGDASAHVDDRHTGGGQ